MKEKSTEREWESRPTQGGPGGIRSEAPLCDEQRLPRATAISGHSSLPSAGALRGARRVIIAVRARWAAAPRPAAAPGSILRRGAAASVFLSARTSPIFIAADSALCCAP